MTRLFHRWRGFRPYERHSLVLMVAGFVYVAVGFSYIVSEPTQNRQVALEYAFTWAPPEAWGFVFILCGAMSILSSRWPPFAETWGYIVLTAISSAWSAFYLVGYVFGDSPASNLSGTLSWGLIGFLWWAISGLVNPTKKRPLV